MKQQEIGYEVSHKELDMPEWERKAWEELAEYENTQRLEKRAQIRRIRRLVGYPFRWIGEILYDSSWHPKGIVNAVSSDHKSYSYPNYTFLKILEDGHLVMRQDERKKFHTLVIQWSRGMEGDSYGGFLYFPLKDGRYWKVEYSC